MKKIIAVISFCACGYLLAQAQDKNVEFGFQFSPAFSSMRTDNNKINRSGTNLGLKLGMISEYYFRENYAISTGIGFAFNHGGSLVYDLGGRYWPQSDLGANLDTLPAGVKLKHSLQFIEIPLMVKMRTREFGRVRYFLEPGLYLNFKSQARGAIEGPGIPADAERINIKRDINGISLAWGMNGGIQYGLAETTSLIAGLGFQVGFTDLTEDKGTVFDPVNGNQRDRSKATGSVLVLKLGVIF
jgi:Outer membrane protein beta-barrel domain